MRMSEGEPIAALIAIDANSASGFGLQGRRRKTTAAPNLMPNCTSAASICLSMSFETAINRLVSAISCPKALTRVAMSSEGWAKF
jgi:hypothetical protein